MTHLQKSSAVCITWTPVFPSTMPNRSLALSLLFLFLLSPLVSSCLSSPVAPRRPLWEEAPCLLHKGSLGVVVGVGGSWTVSLSVSLLYLGCQQNCPCLPTVGICPCVLLCDKDQLAYTWLCPWHRLLDSEPYSAGESAQGHGI